MSYQNRQTKSPKNTFVLNCFKLNANLYHLDKRPLYTNLLFSLFNHWEYSILPDMRPLFILNDVIELLDKEIKEYIKKR